MDTSNLNDRKKTGTQHSSSDHELECFAQRLSILRGDRSVRSFARSAGVSESVMRRYLAGESEPTRPALLALARESGVSVGWLATGDGLMYDDAGPNYLYALEKELMGKPAIVDTPALHEAQPGDIDELRLVDALVSVDQVLMLMKQRPTPRERARLAVSAYRIMGESQSVGTTLAHLIEIVMKSVEPGRNK